jgi:hypothetical protein
MKITADHKIVMGERSSSLRGSIAPALNEELKITPLGIPILGNRSPVSLE